MELTNRGSDQVRDSGQAIAELYASLVLRRSIEGAEREGADSLYNGYVKRLNREQRAAAEFEGGHLLVLAGAGTGKTMTIVARAIHLLKTGTDPRRLLLLTFTRRAAKEMTNRLKVRVGPGANKIIAGTFHHFCLTTMRRMPLAFGIGSHTVIDRDDQLQLMKLARSRYIEKGNPFPKAKELVDLFSYARNKNRSVAKYVAKYTDHDKQTIRQIVKVFKAYAARKRANAYLDFDDILHVFARRLRDQPKTRKRIRDRYDHILVDEMQDTNPLQWRILNAIRDPAKLFCVGDDAQSIFAFRGADFRNVHSFTERIKDGAVMKLERNYRSTQPILDLANWLLDTSPLTYDKHLIAARGKGERPRLVDFESGIDEALWIANDLIERFNDGAEWRDHMMLTRTARAVRDLEAALVENKIPYRFIGGTSLLQSAHVKDLLSLLRSAQSPLDELAWMRYLTLWPRIGDLTAAKVIEELKACHTIEDAFPVLRDQFPTRPEIIKPIRVVHKRHDEPGKAVGAAAKALTPLLEERYERWDMRKQDFPLLRRLASKHKNLRSFIETYTLDPISESVAQRLEDDDAVTLITVHSAKGTEADVCYIIRAETGMYPHIRSLGDEDDEEEERRILYVAMTRARNELILTRTNTIKGFFVPQGGRATVHSKGGQGYLLEDLPDELVERSYQD